MSEKQNQKKRPVKRPDLVVFNEDTQSYDASLRPYGTSLSAPVIKNTDASAWKDRSINKVNHHLKARFLEIKAQYEEMKAQYEYNEMIYHAQFNFEPVIGKIYHLYNNSNGSHFLSLISPDECNFDFVGSFYLDAEMIWHLEKD